MNAEEEADLLAAALHLLMAGSGGLWWIGHPDGDIQLDPGAGEI